MRLPLSLRLVDEEGDLLEFKIKETIFLVHGMATKIVTQNDVPVRTISVVQELL